MSKLVIYSLVEINGNYQVSIGLTNRIKSMVENQEIIIDAPGTGLKKFAWFPYIVKRHIFDNGHCFFMIQLYKRYSMKDALKDLIAYKRDGRKNKKDYLQV